MNVLFLSHRVPYAPNRGDRVRAFHILHELSRWATVDVAALAHDDDEASRGPDLSVVARRVAIARVPGLRNMARAALAWPTSVPTTHSLLDSPDLGSKIDALTAEARPDVVFCFCTGIAPFVFRPSLAGIPLVLDMVDVDSEKWASLAASSPIPRSWVYAREARVLRAFEQRVVGIARATLVVNERERTALLAENAGARVLVVENGVDVEGLRPAEGPSEQPVVVFCGVMNYEPNAEAVLWFANDVWPGVLKRHPQARFKIVGASPSSAVLALAEGSRGIEVTGSVPDVRPHLWSAAVSVAPIKTSRGIQNKVLEALASGLPTVVTPVVMDGLPAAVAPACAVAAGAGEFADAVSRLLALPPVERRRRAGAADLSSLSWHGQLAGLREILADSIR
ncbi:MAG TPA: TIGR03087 family PEP-CTERM/XrtA system glycosyltransferase [Vicinamibacterales bacterium]|nr:TIGR03087 family PEP-CTERM/XrtA system glycosyltransferase [Vicinamibacterales bacterium]